MSDLALVQRLMELGLTRKQFAAVIDILVDVERAQEAAPRAPAQSKASAGQKFVYIAGTAWDETLKIGFSRNPWARVNELATGSATAIGLLATFKTQSYSEVELHTLLAEYRSHREWFNLPTAVTDIIKAHADHDEPNYDALLVALRSATTAQLRSDATSLSDPSPPKETPPAPPRETTSPSEGFASLTSSVAQEKFDLTEEAAPQPNGVLPYPEDFEEIWREYRFVGPKTASKSAGHKAFARLSANDKKACYVGLLDYIQLIVQERSKRSDYPVKHLATFINERGWEPFLEDVA